MAVLPPLVLYEDYWPSISHNMPDVAAILSAMQKLIVIGEKRRIELIKKRRLIDRVNIQLQALRIKLNEIELAIDADAEIIDAWCIDYTLEIPVGTTIGTMETPGEATFINIQRGYEEDDDTGFAMALYNDRRDGIIQPIYPVSFLSGANWFFNAAMKAAWQKWMPLFRYGTITEMIDQVDGTRNCNISLDASTEASTILSGVHGLLSTGDVHYIAGPTGLNINQTDELTDVPFQYMDCDDVAFNVDDEVLIEFRELPLPIWTRGEVATESLESGEFVAQTIMTMKSGWIQSGYGPARDWSQPVVIGFQHDPQPCELHWAYIYRIKPIIDKEGQPEWYTEMQYAVEDESAYWFTVKDTPTQHIAVRPPDVLLEINFTFPLAAIGAIEEGYMYSWNAEFSRDDIQEDGYFHFLIGDSDAGSGWKPYLLEEAYPDEEVRAKVRYAQLPPQKPVDFPGGWLKIGGAGGVFHPDGAYKLTTNLIPINNGVSFISDYLHTTQYPRIYETNDFKHNTDRMLPNYVMDSRYPSRYGTINPDAPASYYDMHVGYSRYEKHRVQFAGKVAACPSDPSNFARAIPQGNGFYTIFDEALYTDGDGWVYGGFTLPTHILYSSMPFWFKPYKTTDVSAKEGIYQRFVYKDTDPLPIPLDPDETYNIGGGNCDGTVTCVEGDGLASDGSAMVKITEGVTGLDLTFYAGIIEATTVVYDWQYKPTTNGVIVSQILTPIGSTPGVGSTVETTCADYMILFYSDGWRTGPHTIPRHAPIVGFNMNLGLSVFTYAFNQYQLDHKADD